MVGRRGVEDVRQLCNGPAKLVVALGIRRADDGTQLNSGPIRVEAGEPLAAHRVRVTRRIGLGRGKALALRYDLRGCPWVSRRW